MLPHSAARPLSTRINAIHFASAPNLSESVQARSSTSRPAAIAAPSEEGALIPLLFHLFRIVAVDLRQAARVDDTGRVGK